MGLLLHISEVAFSQQVINIYEKETTEMSLHSLGEFQNLNKIIMIVSGSLSSLNLVETGKH